MTTLARNRTSQYGFFPEPGKDYTSGSEPEIAARLDKLGKALRLHLLGVSGARTPAHSVEVGGFANDPHTRGQASDTPGIESVPETVLRRFGLTRPFAGSGEADHIQLLGGARGTTRNMSPRGKGYTIGELWTQAGGPRNMAPMMTAIAMAESGGRTDAVGGPNTDGTYDYGLFQVNSSHSQYDVNKLVSDPLYNARAAVAIWRSQGLQAWSTFNNGAYRTYLGQTGARPTYGGTRPGGDTSNQPSGIDAAFASYTAETSAGDGLPKPKEWNVIPVLNVPIPANWSPLDIFKAASGAVSSTGDFLKWVSWIFHPRNVLRIVEFMTGLTFIVIGIHTAVQVHKDAPAESTGAHKARRAAGKVFAATPPGRELRVARGARAGRQSARATRRRKEYESGYKRGKSQDGRKQRKVKTRQDERAQDRKYGGVPF